MVLLNVTVALSVTVVPNSDIVDYHDVFDRLHQSFPMVALARSDIRMIVDDHEPNREVP